jgi:malonyl-CoA O-methyltransferase
MQLKTKIKNHFNRASNSYDKVASVQKQSAGLLITKLQNFDSSFYPQTILDLGTGTGYISEILLSHYQNSLYTLTDIAPKMIEIVKNKFLDRDNFKFHVGDIENDNYQSHNLIISNLALQWINNLEKTLEKFYKKSNILAFSCLLDGTFKEWDNILRNYNVISVFKKYPKEKVLISFLNKLNPKTYHFDSMEFQLTFPNNRSFIYYLKNLGVNASNKFIPINILKSLIKEADTEFTVTYKIFFGIMKRI